MGEENSIPRSDPRQPKQQLEAEGGPASAASMTASGETTLEAAGGATAAAARAKERVSIGPLSFAEKTQ